MILSRILEFEPSIVRKGQRSGYDRQEIERCLYGQTKDLLRRAHVERIDEAANERE